MKNKWYLVVHTEETYERNNYKEDFEYTKRYELAEGLELYLPGQREKSYIRSVTEAEGGIRAVLVRPVEYATELSSDTPLDLYYSDYRESCGDGSQCQPK